MGNEMEELKLQPWIFDRAGENEVAVFATGELVGEYGTEEEIQITLTSHSGDDMRATVELRKGADKVSKTMTDLAEALNYVETLCPGEVYELFEEEEQK